MWGNESQQSTSTFTPNPSSYLEQVTEPQVLIRIFLSWTKLTPGQCAQA